MATLFFSYCEIMQFRKVCIEEMLALNLEWRWK